MTFSTDRPLFEVVIPTASVEERRLITAEKFAEMTGIAPTGDNLTSLLRIIDGVSAECARYCKLRRAGTTPPTFGRESVKATWLKASIHHHHLHHHLRGRGPELLLPWRAPITEITVTEAGVELDAGDFRHTGAGILQRIFDGAPGHWSGDSIVVEYLAGWDLDPDDASAEEAAGDVPPADLIARVVDQVKMVYMNRPRDPGLLSENFVDIWQGTYAVGGGSNSSIGDSGLLKSLETALEPFRAPAVLA